MTIRTQGAPASWRIAAAVAAALAAGVATQPAFAQEESLTEVTVTGSRIVRRDLTASSPIVTVSDEAFDKSSAVSVESVLNQMPQFKPNRTQFVATDVQASAFNTPGISAIDLRGIGQNRTLSLIDGRRTQPANATLVFDVNSIPSAAIANVEIISGGASATYGADAIAGVVNFKMKKDFQGLVFDAQTGITEQGDGSETRISALLGGNFGDGRGNAMVGLEVARRGAILQKDRDFYVQGYNDPLTTGGPLYTLASYNPAGPNAPSQAAVNAIFGTTGTTVARGTNFYVNSDGSLFKQSPARRYNSNIPGIKLVTTNNTLAQSDLTTQLSSPLDRYSMFARAHFDFNDNVSAFFQGNFSSFQVDQALGYAPATSFWAASIPVDAAHPVPAELATLLASRANPNANWSFERILDYIGPRGSSNTTTVYQVLAGLEGKLGLKDWTWEAYASHGETNTTNYLNSGFASYERYNKILQAPNYGANFTAQDPSGGILGYKITCTSGLPVFTDFVPSQDCLDAITIRMKNITTFKQDIAEANFQGGIVDLPGGELRGAFGLSYRKNTVSFDPDTYNDAEMIIDRPIGLFAANDTAGSLNVREVYGELLVPVVKDLTFLKELSLELGGRYSDYSTEGGLTTYKALANFKFNDFVTFRGGYQRANRAPNTAELYTGKTTTVAGFPQSDPCANTTLAAYGNIPANANRAQVQALCTAIIGNTTSQYTLGGPANYIGGNGGFFPLELEQRRGNPNIESEKAKTYTAGVVLRSPFESATISNLTAAIDWYSITIDDAISPLPGTTIYENCFNANGTSNPTYSLNDPGGYCKLIFRDPVTGGRATVDSPYSNLGTIKTSGLDTQINWRAPFADLGAASLPGALSASLAFNYTFKFDTQSIPGGAFVHNVGTLAQNGQYRYRTNFRLGYDYNLWGTGLTWLHLPSIKNAAAATAPTTTLQGAGAYDLFNLDAHWNVTSAISLRIGVDNLLDKAPEVVGANVGLTQALGSTVPNYYDVLGRRYYAGVKVTL
jgi:outer membrane receptor protein involved in Fe transport